MPARYDYSTGYYRLDCLGCGQTTLIDHPSDRDALTPNGNLVRETHSWVNNRSEFYPRCRTCERALRATQRARRGTNRVPGTTAGVSVGRNRRYGVELELIFRPGEYQMQQALNAAGLVGWDVRGDGSLSSYGIEIVSPVLMGDEGRAQIRTACRVIREQGATVDRSCGFHAHFEIRELTVDQIKSVVRGWVAQQDLIDGLVSPSRRTETNSYYCRPLGSSDLRRIEGCQTTSDLRTVFGTRHYVDERYRTLNLAAYGRYGTVEIRQHQGTADVEKILSWIDLGLAIIDSTATTPDLATPRATVRELIQTLGDRLDETAGTYLLGRAVRFGHATV